MVKMLIITNACQKKEIADERKRMDRLREEEHQRQAEEYKCRIEELLNQVERLEDSLTNWPRMPPSYRTTTDAVKLTRLGENDVEDL